jgi:hypothetical protein
MKNYFEIKTLSDCKDCNQKNYLRSGSNMINTKQLGLSEGWLDDIFNIFGKIFGSVDKGHWEGSLFIPGDLASRIQTTQARIAASGYSQYAVQSEWYPILLTPGIWQEAIGNYINNVLKGRAEGTVAKYGGTTQSSIFSTSSLIPLLLLGGLAFGFLSTPSKTKRRSS